MLKNGIKYFKAMKILTNTIYESDLKPEGLSNPVTTPWFRNHVQKSYVFNYVAKLVLVLAGIMFSIGLKAQQPVSFVSDHQRVYANTFDSEVKKMMLEVGVPGSSIAIIENNQVAYAKNYGYKQLEDKDPVTDNSVFEACSLSKMLLVYVVQKLADEQKIDLNKPLYQYLEYEPLKHDPRYKLITAHMILSHSSGIENWQWENDPKVLEIVAEPGSKFVYSGEGFQYMAKVVAKILNEPYDVYVSKMVLGPLHLNSTYLKYVEKNDSLHIAASPTDYAVGYSDMEVPVKKWKNADPVPASGMHTTAADYARLIIGMFNEKNLSAAGLKRMTKPVIRMNEGSDAIWLSEGFFLLKTPDDTLAFFNGINNGFKSEIFYSVKNKRGFVLFTNSDRGELMTGYLSQLTTKFNLNALFTTSFYSVYPSQAISLFRMYREKNTAAMLTEIQNLKTTGTIKPNTLNELGDTFMSHDMELSRKLLEMNIELFPDSSLSYCLLGGVYYQTKKYDLAYANLTKAKQLNFDMWDIEGPLKDAKANLSKAK